MTTAITGFDPPAFLSDFDGTLRKAWSQRLTQHFQENIQEIKQTFAQQGHASAIIQFYDPTKQATPSNAQVHSIVWNAFPNVAKNIFPNQRAAFQGVENPLHCNKDGNLLIFRPQDEYCEWFVKKNSSGNITSVTFTCEGPEYWEFLAQNDPQKLLGLYQQYVDPAIKMNDLFLTNKQYNSLNKWNVTQGIMHLSHPANTLQAEINIAAQATILRKDVNGNLITDTNDLICCAQYGEPQRDSDPTIGKGVNQLASRGYLITLQNPVGLYMQGLDTTGWTTPDHSDPQQYWRVERGDASKEMIVRAVYEVPDAAGFTVSDIKINGSPIEFGGQIAQGITMHLSALAFKPNPPLSPTSIPTLNCTGNGAIPGCPEGGAFSDLCQVVGAQTQAAPTGAPHNLAGMESRTHHSHQKTRSGSR